MRAGTATLTLDVEKLLAPISIERPAGEWLRYEGTYDRIREARWEDDPDLQQGIWERDLKRADWATVEVLCLEALETRSKDLQLAVWLAEAWIHLHGFAGVREGLKLLIGLCESFWEQLYPEREGDDLDRRLAPLEWMDEKFPVLLKQLPITQPRVQEISAHSWVDWQSACHLEQLAKKHKSLLEAAAAEGKATLAKFFISAKLTPYAFFARLLRDVSETIKAASILERILDEACGKKSPSLEQFKSALFGIRRLVHDMMKEQPAPEEHAFHFEESENESSAADDESFEVEDADGDTRIRSRAVFRW
jgi:type VI secretion system protein ImpA